jgi:hypothetical protein
MNFWVEIIPTDAYRITLDRGSHGLWFLACLLRILFHCVAYSALYKAKLAQVGSRSSESKLNFWGEIIPNEG